MKDKEEIFLENRLKELANKAYLRNISTYSNFLNLYEQTIFFSIKASLPDIRYEWLGGYEAAERRIVCFLPSYQENMPDIIRFLRIEAVNERFADDLSHRDFLGAFMNLGLERHMIGDICISENKAHLIVLECVKDIIIENLQYVKKTKVKVVEESVEDIQYINRYQEMAINVASNRLDGVIAATFKLSRSLSNEYFDKERVFVNGKMTTNHSYMIKEGDLISVRGRGRFKFLGNSRTSKKGRLFSDILLYI